MEVTLRKIPYLEDLEEDILHELMYSMTESIHPKGSRIFEFCDKAQEMYIVVQGHIVLARKIQGGEFPLERLYRGSIINSTLFLNKGKLEYYAVCGSTVILKSLSHQQMEKLR